MEYRFNGRCGKGYMRNVCRPQKRREAELRDAQTSHVRTKAHRLNKCGCDA